MYLPLVCDVITWVSGLPAQSSGSWIADSPVGEHGVNVAAVKWNMWKDWGSVVAVVPGHMYTSVWRGPLPGFGVTSHLVWASAVWWWKAHDRHLSLKETDFVFYIGISVTNLKAKCWEQSLAEAALGWSLMYLVVEMTTSSKVASKRFFFSLCVVEEAKSY